MKQNKFMIPAVIEAVVIACLLVTNIITVNVCGGGTAEIPPDLAAQYAEPDLTKTEWSQEKQAFAEANPMYRELEAIYMRFSQGHADLVCLGDSITQKFSWQDAFYDRRVANRGIGSDTTLGILARLDSVVSLKPDTISLMAGINDLAQNRTAEEIVESYRQILQELKRCLPETKLVVSSVLPVTAEHTISAAEILQVNALLKQLCQEENVIFLDIFQAFADENSALKPELALDTVHLSVQGYALWLSYLSKEVL